MKSNNICKFPIAGPINELSVFCFVYETEDTVMKQTETLSHSRMILVEQGEGVMSFDGTECPFSAGTLIFGFEGERFTLLRGSDVRYLYIEFGGARADSLFRRFGIYPHARKNEAFNGAIPFCKDCLLNARQENFDIISESVLLYVFSRLSAAQSTQNAIIQRIIEITEEEFHDTELSMTQIAERIGYNPKYLSHFFKEKMNVGYKEYLSAQRFKYAVSLFEHGISSVKNVALLSGFSDPLYFSNAFKKAIGLSPKEYIAALSDRTDEAGEEKT